MSMWKGKCTGFSTCDHPRTLKDSVLYELANCDAGSDSPDDIADHCAKNNSKSSCLDPDNLAGGKCYWSAKAFSKLKARWNWNIKKGYEERNIGSGPARCMYWTGCEHYALMTDCANRVRGTEDHGRCIWNRSTKFCREETCADFNKHVRKCQTSRITKCQYNYATKLCIPAAEAVCSAYLKKNTCESRHALRTLKLKCKWHSQDKVCQDTSSTAGEIPCSSFTNPHKC